MVPLLLIVLMVQGVPQIHAFRTPSVETCWAVIPEIRKYAPDTASFVCIEVQPEDAV